ncbi:MAG: FAD-dependent oxidoreductase [bacterium]
MTRPTKNDYDIVVIGAGPAGSEIAYQLARRRYRVLVVERDRLDREKPCGGGIQLKELLDFGPLPDRVIERKIRRAVFISPSGHELEVAGRDKELFTVTVRRSAYDRYLQQRAEAASASFLADTCVTAIERSASGFHVRATGNEGPCAYAARLVANASGVRGGALSRMLGIDGRPEEFCVTCHHWLRIPDVDKHFRDCIELYYTRECPEGYIWIFPKQDVLSVGIGTVAHVVKQHRLNLRELLTQFLRRHPIASAKLRGTKFSARGAD